MKTPRSTLQAPPIRSLVDVRSEQFERNRADVLEQLAEIEVLLDEAAAGGGPRAHERLERQGKMPVRERIALLLDPDSPFLEISPLAGFGSVYPLGAAMVCGIGVVAGVETMIVANDPSVLGGALNPYGGKKWTRAMEIARTNRIPYISLVESAGADLRPEGRGVDGDGQRKAQARPIHFAESGRVFYDLSELSKLGIPTVCIVFGSSTAGATYIPGMSDYNIFVEDRAKVFLAGPPLVKVATGEDSDDETLGGARMHAEVSGLADYLARDERDAIGRCRQVISHLNWRKQTPEPAFSGEEPRYDPAELLGIVPRDLRQPFDMREVIARIVDGSRFEEFKQDYGSTLVCGWASIYGYPVGILGNNGVLFPDSAEKGAHFIQLCNQIAVPLLFLHNITGFMVGRDYERRGIVKKGAQLLNAIANSTVPHLTLITGASYGAGNFGMSGRAFDNRFTFLWPTAKIAVMGPKQIAGVMSIVRRTKAERAGEPFDEAADRELVRNMEEVQEAESLGLNATGAISDDGIIDPRDTRHVLGLCLSVTHNAPIQGTDRYAVFRL